MALRISEGRRRGPNSSRLALLSIAVLAACDPEPGVRYELEPFEGNAFPRTIPPVALPEAGMGLVSDSLSDTLSLVDLGTGERFDVRPVGRDPVGVDGPHHVAVPPAGGFAYVALSYPPVAAAGPHASHGASEQPGYVQKLSLADLSVVGQARVDPSPGDVVASEDGRRVVVTHFDLRRALSSDGDPEAARASLALVDPDGLAEIGSPAPRKLSVCVAPHGVALSRPDGRTALVACYGEDALAVVDLDALSVAARVPVAASPGPVGDPAYGPYAVLLSASGRTAFVSNIVSKDVRIFDVSAGAMGEAVLRPGGAPFFPALSDEGRLFVPTQSPDAIVVYDVSALEAPGALPRHVGAGLLPEVARLPFSPGECPAPHVASLAAGRLWLVCEGDREAPGKVISLAKDTLERLSEADVGVYPDAFVPVGAKP